MRRIDLKKANVARSNTIRNINRQIVLNYVRERGPISRAEIAHETALQRSTVSLIVEELRVEGLIEELSGESTGGRPPILLSLRTADAVAIGVDLGTTRTIVARMTIRAVQHVALKGEAIARLHIPCQDLEAVFVARHVRRERGNQLERELCGRIGQFRSALFRREPVS